MESNLEGTLPVSVLYLIDPFICILSVDRRNSNVSNHRMQFH